MALRATRQVPRSDDPNWISRFIDGLRREDLSAATVRGYGYDPRHFLVWHETAQGRKAAIEQLTEFDLIAYRQAMIAAGNRSATVNRRLDALRRLCRWAQETGAMAADIASNLRRFRLPRNRRPLGVRDAEVHALLRGGRRLDPRARPPQLCARPNHAAVRAQGGELAALRIAGHDYHAAHSI